MNIVLLSGGSGKRLWPLSNDIRSKQFIKIFKTENGGYQSMVQRVYGQIKSVMPDAEVTIATAKSQVSSIINQLGEQAGISVEPCRRDTFPAIALAAAYLADEGVAVRAGLHCAPCAHESAGTLETGTVRVSFGHDASYEQTKALLQAVSKLLPPKS